MTMSTLSRSSTFSPAGIIPWMLNLASRMLACSLNMPEPLVHNTGVFVFAHVQAVENSVGRTLCPICVGSATGSASRLIRHPSTRSSNGELS
jgi:hypothetical protein